MEALDQPGTAAPSGRGEGLPSEDGGPLAAAELLSLAGELRRRAEQSHESDWAAAPAPGAPAAPMPPAEAGPGSSALGRLKDLEGEIHACRRCPLGGSRLNAVPGVGSYQAKVMFIGEGPGFDEDHKGEPFVGRSGQLLDKIMEAIGLSRKTVYIANIVKCHPMKDPSDPEARGNDRPPTPDEVAACRPYLDEQIRLISPRVIVTLGAVPTRVLLETAEPITRIRGQWRLYTPKGDPGAKPVKLLPTFHPAALLRNPELKKDVWTDMKSLRKELESGGER